MAESKEVIQTVGNHHPAMSMVQRHVVNVPPLCPATANPQAGSTLTVTYIPNAKLLELYALTAYVHSFVGHQTVRDIEHFAQTLAQDCANALGVPVSLRAHFVLHLNQVVQLIIKATPNTHADQN